MTPRSSILDPALLALALALLGSPARAASCDPPSWFRDGGLKPGDGLLVGLGKSADVEKARRDARRDIGRKIVKERGREILGWPSVKGKVNFKIYSEAEIARALGLALASHLPDGKRLKSEPICKALYVAVGIDRKDALARLREAPDLGEDVAAVLAGQVDKLEERRKEALGFASQGEFSDPEQTVERLRKLAKAMSPQVLLETHLVAPLERKADKLAADIAAAKAVAWEEDRKGAVAATNETALTHEKFIAAVKAWKTKDYAAAADTFRVIALTGDVSAQLAMGVMSLEAKGVRRDYAEAMQWLKKAAAQNDGPAKVLIAAMQLSGQVGGKASNDDAFKWITSAAADGWTCQWEVRQCRKK